MTQEEELLALSAIYGPDCVADGDQHTVEASLEPCWHSYVWRSVDMTHLVEPGRREG